MKKSISKTHRILHSPNGLVHGLVKNLKFPYRFVLCKKHREKVFGDVLVKKQACLDIEEKCLLMV